MYRASLIILALLLSACGIINQFGKEKPDIDKSIVCGHFLSAFIVSFPPPKIEGGKRH